MNMHSLPAIFSPVMPSSIPLITQSPSPMPTGEYPYDALPALVQNAVYAVHCYTQSPLPMIGTFALSLMAEAVQGVANVQIPSGPLCSLSLAVLAIVESGGGKTPALNMLRKAVVEFENALQLKYAGALKSYEAELKIWQLTNAEYEKALRKAVAKSLDLTDVQNRLLAHQQAKPKKPRHPILTYANPTIEALVNGLANYWQNAALVSDEASAILNGRVTQVLALLNSMLDGAKVSMERKGEPDPIIVQHPRLTAVLALQPGQLEKYFKRTGDDALDIGFMARMLVCKPLVLPGTRNVQPVDVDPQFLAALHERVTSLLQQGIAPDGEPIRQKKVVVFSPEAAEAYVGVRQYIEQQQMPGGAAEHIKDFAAKAGRHVAKLAAIMEIVVNDSYVISLDMLQRATRLIYWHADEYRLVFAKPAELPQPFVDANLLCAWLHNFSQTRTPRYVMKNDVLKHAPSALRNKQRLEEALQVLQQQGRVGWHFLYQGKMQFLDLFPSLPADQYALEVAINQYRMKKTSFRQ
ncbi:YfjI family protein [Vogesella sp. LIG4]|uniref:YfjI family protein n=1 Tax=Vogesella sp. LIG4 TaxID=1192162 RepID=UPI00081F9379|nr:YfjI family protein [Vogesella sp. LIG4]SCK09200.1 Protein of unknown function [Vogesella sp. LIG4]